MEYFLEVHVVLAIATVSIISSGPFFPKAESVTEAHQSLHLINEALSISFGDQLVRWIYALFLPPQQTTQGNMY